MHFYHKNTSKNRHQALVFCDFCAIYALRILNFVANFQSQAKIAALAFASINAAKPAKSGLALAAYFSRAVVLPQTLAADFSQKHATAIKTQASRRQNQQTCILTAGKMRPKLTKNQTPSTKNQHHATAKPQQNAKIHKTRILKQKRPKA